MPSDTAAHAAFNGAGLRGSPALFDLDMSQFRLDADSAQRVRDYVNAHQAGNLEERLSRMERTLEQTLALLYEIAERSTEQADKEAE
jgi:hypothetical protein